jgi:hypothetical protein
VRLDFSGSEGGTPGAMLCYAVKPVFPAERLPSARRPKGTAGAFAASAAAPYAGENQAAGAGAVSEKRCMRRLFGVSGFFA